MNQDAAYGHDLDDDFDQLQKQLKLMKDEDQFNFDDDDADLMALLNESDDEDLQEEKVEGYPKVLRASTILVIDNTLNQFEEALKGKEQELEGKRKNTKTEEEVEKWRERKEKEMGKFRKYFKDLLGKKKGMLKEIKEGKLTWEGYVSMLKDYNLEQTVNAILKSEIQKQRILLTKFQTPETFFQKISTKFQKSLPAQQEKINAKEQKPSNKPDKVFQKPSAQQPLPPQPVQPPPKQLTPQQQQQIAIQKMDTLPISKKLQFTLKSSYKIQSYMEYFLKNLEPGVAKIKSKELFPTLKMCREVIGNLNSNVNVPVGNFLVREVPKMTFERFHSMSKKEYLTSIQTMIMKIKGYMKSEQAFSKKCSQTTDEKTQSPKQHSDKNIELYTQYLVYLNAIKLKQFCPLPKLQTKQIQRVAFIQNPSIPKNQLHLKINSITGIPSGCTLKVYIPQQQEQNLHSEYVNQPGEQKIMVAIKLKEELVRDLTRLEIVLKFTQKKMLMFKSDVGEITINTKDLQFKNYINTTVQKDKLSVKYQILTRYPRNKATKTKIQQATLHKIPQYTFDSHKETQFLRKYLRNYIPAKQPRPPTLFYVQRTEELQKRLKGIEIEGVAQGEVVEPQSYSSSVEYIGEMDKVVDVSLNTIFSFKENRKILERIQDVMVSVGTKLRAQLEKKKVGKKEYSEKLEGEVERDERLRRGYEKEGLGRMAEFVGCRLRIVKQELETLVIEIRIEQEAKQEEQNKKKLEEESQKQSQSPDQPQLQLHLIPQQNPKLSEKPLDIRTPWLPEFCKCLTYLQKMSEIVIEEDLKNQFIKAKDDFMEGFNSGEIDAEGYQANLKGYLEADRNRLAVYLVEEVPEYAKFISARIKIIEEELNNFQFEKMDIKNYYL